MRAALAEWIGSGPAAGPVWNYFTDADNLRALVAKGRSSKQIVNEELRAVHQLLAPSNLHIRVHWHPRSCWAGVLAGHLSRGDVQAFRETSARFGSKSGPAHPAAP